MTICDNLLHPFKTDPGASQRQRIAEVLLTGAPQIDGRKMADLLDYFVQVSRHINYYDAELNISDWQPFFKKSVPFVLASLIKYDGNRVNSKFEGYNKLFDKHPSKQSLQLLLHFVFYYSVNRINNWHLQLKNSSLPVAVVMAQLIKDKLNDPIKNFILLSNTAVKYYGIKKINFSSLLNNDVWALTALDLANTDEHFSARGKTKRSRLISLNNDLKQLLPSFLHVIKITGTAAEGNMEQSLFPLKEELQQLHTPHLGLLFAFLKLFKHLQSDLNSYTRKHLDFFYREALQLKPSGAIPDKAHILFEIQNQLDKYLLKKGLLVKDGKDINKAEIVFGLQEEIVVNKAEVADVKTLFLNYQTAYDTNYIEGLYAASNALKADGVKIDFKDNDPKNWPTGGAKFSKYKDPEQQFIKPYPNARMGFILASPVLLLNEGNRTIDITLACQMKNICGEQPKAVEEKDKCCEDKPGANADAVVVIPKNNCIADATELLKAAELFTAVQEIIKKQFYYISKDLIAQAVKKGISNTTIEKIVAFLKENKKLCYCPAEQLKYDATIEKTDFEKVFAPDELLIIQQVFKPQYPLRILFSGEKGWIEPSEIISPDIPFDAVTFSPLNADKFTIHIKAVLKADKPAVTFYNKEKLKEDFNTEQPLAKIELNDFVKKIFSDLDFKTLVKHTGAGTDCCLYNKNDAAAHFISLYHFFSDVSMKETVTNKTEIKVTVCGLKNFVVQNDEAVQDVNGPVYPFGTRPDVPDFTVDTIAKVYCITRELIADALAAGISNATKNLLESILGSKKSHRLKSQLEDFLNTIPNASDRNKIQALFNNPLKKYCKLNLVGPNFYIGSKEVFCKKWDDVFININWKEKPVDFNEYYKAYWVDPTDFSKYGINEDNFQINIAVIDNGVWKKEKIHALTNPPPANTFANQDTNDNNRPLFKNDELSIACTSLNPVEQTIHISKTYFDAYSPDFRIRKEEITKYLTDTSFGFLRINLQNQDFLHKNYSFVLARQMMALGKFPKEFIEDATYVDAGGTVFVFENTAGKLVALDQLINQMQTEATQARTAAQLLNSRTTSARDAGSDGAEDITDAEFTTSIDLNTPLQDTVTNTDEAFQKANETKAKYLEIKNSLSIFDFGSGKIVKKLAVLIPNEPWTPIIKNISLDYTATADIKDIDLIHLYPYEGTFKPEEIALQPTLFPIFCDEGNLFIGLRKLIPGSNVNMLFQLAEATADAESEREEINWYYLQNNIWKNLRKGFEVLNDDTNGLTTSGIVKLALPANITNDNTILPKDLHWIKAAISKNSKTLSETIGIHTQAIKVLFTNDVLNDKMRLSEPLPAQSIAKLKEADTAVKKVNQPYDSFGGSIPEIEGQFYVRVSELLRHKGRAIQKFDYERLALQAFPELFKVKCINHSYGLNANRFNNDFPVAPGYVLLAVIPDLNKLKAGQSYEPRVPVSILEKIVDYLCRRTSPFVRLKVMNPRYEKINFCLKVKLYLGKDEVFYKEKLQQDIRNFLAPWAIGQYDKLTFGQSVNRSDIAGFLETRDYIDYLLELKMAHEFAGTPPSDTVPEIVPQTPRSILIAGEIDVCIKQNNCDDWDNENKCENKPQSVVDYCKQHQDPVIT